MRRVWHGRTQITDTNGDPVVGAKITFLAAGTANLLDTYSDYALSSANTNPVVSDAGGWVTIFLKKNTLYDYTTTDSDDVTIYAKVTNVSGIEPPLTTKGDLFTFDTDFQRLAVGTNTHVLTADSSEATGIKWAAQASDATVTTKGDIYTYDSAAARLPVGNNNSILIADSGETTGLKWVAELVRATSSSTLALSTATWTTVEIDTETQDSDAIFNTGTYTATIADAGWYVGHFWGKFASSVNNGECRFVIGTTELNGGNASNDELHGSFVRYLDASDTVLVQVLHSTTTNTLAAGAMFQLRRFG